PLLNKELQNLDELAVTERKLKKQESLYAEIKLEQQSNKEQLNNLLTDINNARQKLDQYNKQLHLLPTINDLKQSKEELKKLKKEINKINNARQKINQYKKQLNLLPTKNDLKKSKEELKKLPKEINFPESGIERLEKNKKALAPLLSNHANIEKNISIYQNKLEEYKNSILSEEVYGLANELLDETSNHEYNLAQLEEVYRIGN